MHGAVTQTSKTRLNVPAVKHAHESMFRHEGNSRDDP